MTRARSVAVLTAASAALIGGPAAAATSATSGCSPSKCVPRTGSWRGPSPQKLTTPYGPADVRLKVTYEKNGKAKKSTYGNTVRSLAMQLRYYCDNETSPWTETGFVADGPLTLDEDGKADVTIPENYAHREHHVTLKFQPTKVTGTVSGSAIGYEGHICSTAVSFTAKFKKK